MVNKFPGAITLPPVSDEDNFSTESEASDTTSVLTSFEGPEKNLEIDFKRGVGHELGFRAVGREDVDAMLDAAQCTILSKVENAHIDAYVLSESSLFVYAHKVVIKTCGTTTLLKTIPFIQEYAKSLGMSIEWVSYSRKNYTFPEGQEFPHTSFEAEVGYLNSFFPDGSAHVLGPLNRDHWYLYVWDSESHESPSMLPLGMPAIKRGPADESTLHVLMQDMHPSVSEQFSKEQNPGLTSRQMTIKSGIRDLVPGAILDDFAFDPCGYSMNGILFDAYYTIHITPESHCSYVSFETNARLRRYESLLKNVLRCFRPSRYTVSVYADRHALENEKNDLFSNDILAIDEHISYKRKGGYTRTTFEGDYLCLMGNWTVTDKTLTRKKTRSPSFA